MTTLREAIESLQRQVAERISDDALSHCWLSLERAQAVLDALAEPQEIRVPMIGACQACGHEHEFPQREPQEPGAPFLCRMGEQEFLLHYIDGRYSFCTDEKGFVHHPVPQRQPLPKHDQHCVDVPGYGLMATKLVRAVERAHGIGGQDE